MLILSVLFEEIFSVMRQNKEYYRYKHEQYSNGCKEELQRNAAMFLNDVPLGNSCSI